jgi:5-deoxy-D-glucuronate isomerase
MSKFLIRNPQGFPFGMSAITHIGEAEHDTGIQFGILKLRSGEECDVTSSLESAHLLIQGQCEFIHDTTRKVAERHSCFDQDPHALHRARNNTATIRAISDCEFAVFAVQNSNDFPTQVFDTSNMLESEKRGKGLLNDTAYRIVRTLFDLRNRPQSLLVLGEVINAPGRWSSYPPHHHAQPEIYHYRFTEKHGYGHAECGEDVFKVRQFDTYKILNQNDHSQTSAPGYAMYYIWAIRHLTDNPYISPEFTKEHQWTKTTEANERVWKGFF